MSCGTRTNCVDEFGCPAGVCADFVIKRYDTKPAFEIIVKDCNDPIDLTDTVVEVSLWAKAKLKTALTVDDTYFSLADGIGFQQAAVGDIVVMETVRDPEHMLVLAFDETNKLIEVQRGYNGTPVRSYKKGSKLRIMRFLNSVGETQMTLQDVVNVDGTTTADVLTESKLIYEWEADNTCLPGCYYLEMKLLKMTETESASFSGPLYAVSIDPSFVSYASTDMGCALGSGVEWVRRFPSNGEGFLVQIVDAPPTGN